MGLARPPLVENKASLWVTVSLFFLPCYLLQIVSLSAFPCLFLKMNTGFGLYFFLLFFSFWFGFNAQGCCMRFGWKALFRIDLYISVLSLPLLGEFGFGVLRTRFPPHIFRVGSSRPNVLLLWAILKERRRVVVEEIAAWRCFGKKRVICILYFNTISRSRHRVLAVTLYIVKFPSSWMSGQSFIYILCVRTGFPLSTVLRYNMISFVDQKTILYWGRTVSKILCSFFGLYWYCRF